MGTARTIFSALLAGVLLTAGCSSEPEQAPDAFGQSFRMTNNGLGRSRVRPTTVYFDGGARSDARWANAQWYGEGPAREKSFWQEVGEFFGVTEDKPVGPQTVRFSNSTYRPVTPELRPATPDSR